MDDFAAHRVVSEYETRDGDHDQQQRREGKHRVIGQSCAHAWRVVIDHAFTESFRSGQI